MTVHMSTKMTAKVIVELDHWHRKQRSFTIHQAAHFLALLEHAATYVIWAKFLFDNIRHSMLIEIRHNRKIVFNNARFRDLIIDSDCTEATVDSLLKKISEPISS